MLLLLYAFRAQWKEWGESNFQDFFIRKNFIQKKILQKKYSVEIINYNNYNIVRHIVFISESTL